MVKLIIKELNFSYCNRHLFDMLDLLVDKYNWKYVEKNDILDANFVYFEKIEYLLLITGSSEIENFNVPKSCKIIYIIDDLHTCGKIKRARSKNYNLVFKIFATYGYCMNKFYSMIPSNKIVWFPHSARYIIPFNFNPINKILISGRVTQEQYPNRFKILQLSKKINFIYYHQPTLNGYRAQNKNDIETQLYGKKFYELLNSYLICFTCDASQNRPYILAKHFEILGSGSLLFACNPNTKKNFESLGFIDEIDYISCNSENMLEKINWLSDIKNLEKINIIRKNGYEKVKNNHTWIHRTNFLNNYLS